jgi:uncharacterized membrane protein YgdD (TMEM256/DUF423 family)
MTSLSRRWIAIGAALGAAGVALGAFGAHWLPGFLTNLGYADDDFIRRREIFETAVRYQMLHALAIVFVGLALENRRNGWWQCAAWAFLIGVALFSGLLKVLTVAGPQWKWLGMIVPLGGLSMIAGWLAVAIGALRQKTSSV